MTRVRGGPQGRRQFARAMLAALGAASLLVADPRAALALGLGEIVSQSSLGEALRLRLAIIADSSEDVTPECFRVAPAARGEDLPQLVAARFAVEGAGSGRRLLVMSPRSINEPVLKVALRIGCDQAAVQRDYVLLLDPPTRIEPALTVPGPLASVAAPAAAAPTGNDATPSASTGPAFEAPSPAKARANARPRSGVNGIDASQAARIIAAPARRKGDRLRLGSVEDGGLPTTPQLRLSSELADARPGALPLSEDALALLRAKQARLRAAPEDQDITTSAETELIVLDKRLKELQSTLDAAQARLQQIEPAAAPAGVPVKVAPKPAAAESSGDYRSWLFTLLALLALALAAYALLQRRKRRAAQAAAWVAEPEPETTPAPAPAMFSVDEVAATRTDSEAPTPAAASESIRPAPGLAYYHVGDTTQQLSVSELAQVTEEARVFITLGHPDKAILALREHVDHHADTAPAPWLMLLDLYRRTNNQAEYDRTAAEFRHRYNAFIPPWEDPGAGQEGPGLETYPHLVKQICDLWNHPTCKVFLDELLYDNRGGNRIGFNLTAYQDIMLLRGILELRTEEEARERAHGVPPRPSAERAAAPPLAPVADLEFELDQDLLPAASNRSALELDHPGILERITLNWGTPHVIHFLESLLFADHTATSSFSEATLSELMLLHDVAAELAGIKHDDAWAQGPGMGRKMAQQ